MASAHELLGLLVGEGLRVRAIHPDETPVADDADGLGRHLDEPAEVGLVAELRLRGVLASARVDEEREDGGASRR